MWHLPRVACGAFLDPFFLGNTFLKTSFKGNRPLFLIDFKVQNLILLSSKYKAQNPILLCSKKILYYFIQLLLLKIL